MGHGVAAPATCKLLPADVWAAFYHPLGLHAQEMELRNKCLRACVEVNVCDGIIPGT